MFNPGKNAYKVEYKYGLYLFKNPAHSIEEYLNSITFLRLLRQYFTEEQITKIKNTLDDNETLIIDFGTCKVSLIEAKDCSFESMAIQKYFNIDNITREYNENGGIFNEESKYIW